MRIRVTQNKSVETYFLISDSNGGVTLAALYSTCSVTSLPWNSITDKSPVHEAEVARFHESAPQSEIRL